MELTRRYETKLETAKAYDVKAILDAKLNATSPERVADYVAFGIENLEAKVQRIKDAQNELKELKAETESQIENIKIGTAEWLSDVGLKSLDGDIVSSIKLYEPKPKEEVVILNEEAVINQGYFKTAVDKTAVKNALKDGADVEGAELKVTHQQDSLTVYKKRGAK